MPVGQQDEVQIRRLDPRFEQCLDDGLGAVRRAGVHQDGPLPPEQEGMHDAELYGHDIWGWAGRGHG
jgi:hypothetical protein